MENQPNIGDQNTQPVGQNPVMQPTVLDKPKNNIVAMLTVGLVCSMVFGVGGYFLGQKSLLSQNYLNNGQNQIPATTNPQVDNSTPTFSPSATPDSTVNWVVYTNSENGYSIKYPTFADGFTRLVCPGEELTVTTANTGNKTSPVTMSSCERGGRYEFETKTTAFIAPAPEKTKYYDIVEDDIVVSGYKAKRYTFTFTNIEDGPYPTWFTSVRINKDNKTYEIYFSDKSKLDLFNQILSTFKFIN